MAMADWPGRGLAQGARQWPVLERLIAHAGAPSPFAAAILVGSFVGGHVDPMSDIDLILIPPDGEFEAAWSRRAALHVTGAVAAWDLRVDRERGMGAHKWITPDLIFVEALIATAASGFRLADPYVVVAGALPAGVTRRPPIVRSEMITDDLHPIEIAYDRLRDAIRGEQGGRT